MIDIVDGRCNESCKNLNVVEYTLLFSKRGMV